MSNVYWEINPNGTGKEKITEHEIREEALRAVKLLAREPNNGCLIVTLLNLMEMYAERKKGVGLFKTN